MKTLPIGLAEFSTEFTTDWGAVMAASVVMTLPIALLFLSMKKLFIGGLIAGATKVLIEVLHGLQIQSRSSASAPSAAPATPASKHC